MPDHEGLTSSVGDRFSLDDFKTWGMFRIEDLFEVRKGKRVTKANRLPGRTRFIGASDRRNGITDFTALDPIFEAHSISIPYNGSVGYAFYQDAPYFASDDVQVLVPRGEISRWAMLFVATAVRFEKDRYSYGYKWHLERMRNTTIRLPSTPAGGPDWQRMEDFMKGLPFASTLVKVEG
ncbi:restriction endonuclease subunit S [Corynebacterium sp. P7003]|uniref:Restriction endonuclease subunit S n=1 Tax=Corynebacterium pygosceleis TaxID=2800406 RepID=A0ABT3WUD1_9CORY|nr:restriction endonuclease subunit S [Corynebacterium pygosceleis]MCX7444909.1 restriction endonuclease subunit S [Corynebacterium pygosceleis]